MRDGKDGVIELPGGRALGFREHGDPDGVPLLYFHGFPGSRYEPGFFDYPGIRVIAVERPGYGQSEPHRQRRLRHWGEDIQRLADKLRLAQFSVIGISGGGPYAMAVTHGLADRIRATLLVCALGPPEAPGMDDAPVRTLVGFGRRPVASQIISSLAARFIRSERMENRLMRMRQKVSSKRTEGVPKEAAARTPEFMQFMVRNWRAALANGGHGLSSDARVYASPWHFDLSEVTTPVHLWHGTHDRVVPVQVGRHYAEQLPNVKAQFSDGDGHFSVIHNSLDAIRETVRSTWK